MTHFILLEVKGQYTSRTHKNLIYKRWAALEPSDWIKYAILQEQSIAALVGNHLSNSNVCDCQRMSIRNFSAFQFTTIAQKMFRLSKTPKRHKSWEYKCRLWTTVQNRFHLSRNVVNCRFTLLNRPQRNPTNWIHFTSLFNINISVCLYAGL